MQVANESHNVVIIKIEDKKVFFFRTDAPLVWSVRQCEKSQGIMSSKFVGMVLATSASRTLVSDLKKGT